MEIVLASNFDDRLVAETRDLPVSTFFGNYPRTLTGGGRPPTILPPVDAERFRRHLEAVHAAHRVFYATINSADLGLHEYRPGFAEAFLREVGDLLDLGVDGFVVALPLLIELLHREHPSVPISVSTFARVRTLNQAEYFRGLGAETIVHEEANRDFALLRGLVRHGHRVEVLVNQTCLSGCPFRAHHLTTSSLAAQPETPCPAFEYPILECGVEYLRDPARLLSSILVRPEDLEVYEEVGVSRFKISGRNKPTDWLVRSARAYASRSYPGNLLDILSFVQVRGPRGFLASRAGASPEVAAFAEAFDALSGLSIDNSRIPKGFLRRIAATDCEHVSCAECGYCGGVAARAMQVRGQPLSHYVPPPGLRAPAGLRAAIGTAAEVPAATGTAPAGSVPAAERSAAVAGVPP